jgi:hypothetical protein
MKNLNNIQKAPSAFEIMYVDTTSPATSHYPNRNVKALVNGKPGIKSVKGGLRKQSIVVRANGQSQSKVSIEFFAAHPAYKLMSIVPVKTEIDPNALAQLLTPVKVKPVKQHKQFDPRSVGGFQSYVQSLGASAA